MEGSSNAWHSEPEVVLETLRTRGWCFGDMQQVKATIVIQSALAVDRTKVVDSVESELLNLDLRSIGGKSLPDPSLLRKSSYLQGPKVLQISSVRDISKSSVDELSKSLNGQRLLRLGLTDGHSDITAIEYSHIPFVPDNVVPGTKICLENKAVIRCGIVCLNSKVLTVLGGVVQSLYEEWQMNKKYSGFSRSSLRQLEESDAGGPPPFVKLRVGSSSGYVDLNFRSSKPISVAGKTEMRPPGGQKNPDQKVDNVDVNLKFKLPHERAEEKPSSSGMRPKEVVESVPVQNQAAAQKLLQKLSQPNQDDRPRKSWKRRGKEKQGDPVVFTLEEYENRKIQGNAPIKDEVLDISRDEILAWQIQNQFNLEDSQLQRGSHEAGAEDIRMSMFNYQRDDSSHHMAHGGRGRGGGSHEATVEDIRMSMFRDDSSHLMAHGGRGRGRGRGRGFHEASAEDIRMSMFNYERDDSSHRMAHGGRGRGRGGGGGRGPGRGRWRERGRGRGSGRYG